jgi:hypothetical protein
VEKLCWLGVPAVAEGDHIHGTRQIAAALAQNPCFATIHVPDVRREVEASVTQARAVLGEDALTAAWAEGPRGRGQALTLEQGSSTLSGSPTTTSGRGLPVRSLAS